MALQSKPLQQFRSIEILHSSSFSQSHRAKNRHRKINIKLTDDHEIPKQRNISSTYKSIYFWCQWLDAWSVISNFDGCHKKQLLP